MNDRRRKIIEVAPDLLFALFTVSEQAITVRCREGLPPDARFVGHGVDMQRDLHYLVFESDAWDPVAPGARLPQLHIQAERYTLAPLLEQAARLIADEWQGAAPDSEGRIWLAAYEAIRGTIE